MIAWEGCQGCDEFVCNVHRQHASDCACPILDVWCEAGRDPYGDEVTPELEQWVADNPYEDEDEE